jgi:hypothetical protein
MATRVEQQAAANPGMYCMTHQQNEQLLARHDLPF